ncbi:hypothetical protein OKZ62_001755 [Vibrio navarrensis]|nr:hypothetical protein [Vibrio navarrensis]
MGTAYYAIINVANLLQSGICPVSDLSHAEMFFGKPSFIGTHEIEGIIFVRCKDKESAKKRVRIEILERTQVEFSLLYMEYATHHCEAELAKESDNNHWLSECIESISVTKAKLNRLRKLRRLSASHLTLEQLTAMIPDNNLCKALLRNGTIHEQKACDSKIKVG